MSDQGDCTVEQDQFYNYPVRSLTFDELIRVTLEVCGPLSYKSISEFIGGEFRLHHSLLRVELSVSHNSYRKFFDIHDGIVHLSPLHTLDRSENPSKWRKLDRVIKSIDNGEDQSMFEHEFLQKSYDEFKSPRKKPNKRRS